jgi:hypothetical protein
MKTTKEKKMIKVKKVCAGYYDVFVNGVNKYEIHNIKENKENIWNVKFNYESLWGEFETRYNFKDCKEFITKLETKENA